MALLDAVARRYGSRPSSILEIHDSWLAYQLDVAAMSAGLRLAAEEPKAAGEPAAGSPPVQASAGYQSLAGKARKMTVPESGVW